MNDADPLAGLPPPDDGPSSPVRRQRPRNYLATGERRRLLWRFMPAALAVFLLLTVVENTWFKRPAPPVPPPVDTRLEVVRGPRPAGDEVIIEQDAEPEPVVPEMEAATLGAAASTLALVRDDTIVFREADLECWQQMLARLEEAGPAAVLRAPAQRVSFSELFGQPRSFRGRLVRLRGTLHRLERLEAPENNYGIKDYWQGWLEPEGGPTNPIIVHFLRLPEGMPSGMKIDEPVEVVGYCLKRHAYNAADAIRLAPLVVALEPVRRPRPAAATGASSLGTWMIVSMAALVGAMALGIGLAGRKGRRRGDEPPVDLATALGGHEPFSVAESLRRLRDEDGDRTTRP